jgi:hypothetical protein|nr:MAG TPA: hypothetical protein [Caudoviricetes sp.]
MATLSNLPKVRKTRGINQYFKNGESIRMRVKKNNTRSLVKHLETLVQGVKNQLESDFDNKEAIQQDLILIVGTASDLSDALSEEQQK